MQCCSGSHGFEWQRRFGAIAIDGREWLDGTAERLASTRRLVHDYFFDLAYRSTSIHGAVQRGLGQTRHGVRDQDVADADRRRVVEDQRQF